MSELISKLWGRAVAGPRRQEAPEELPSTNVVEVESVPSNNGRLLNREISDLLFIQRVMAESENINHPLFERVRFLSIAADVLDQFYAVRVAKLKRSVAKGDGYVTPDGLTAAQQFLAVTQHANELLQAQQAAWEVLQRELTAHRIVFPMLAELTPFDLDWLSKYFRNHLLHVLTPFRIDEEHPFPFIASGGLCAILELGYAHIVMPLPATLTRFISIPGQDDRFITIEMLVRLFWEDLFPDEQLRSFGVFQIFRDNDLAKVAVNDDLRAVVESGLRMRRKANVIQLSVSDSMSDEAIKFISEQLGLDAGQMASPLGNRSKTITMSDFVFSAKHVGLANISEIVDALTEKFPNFTFPVYKPRNSSVLEKFENDCFAALQDQDIVVHWPYESFGSVVRFLEQSAQDPQVVAIKQTLYRTSDQSPIVGSLIIAAQNGKTVLAVVELEARDNEQSNIQLAQKMEAAGVQVIYGIVGLKIHCKATLVVRMEDDEAVTYTHLGTGNYHPKNAKMYTDISFFTRDAAIGHDTHLVFGYLTSETLRQPTKLLVAPYFLRQKLHDLIHQEIGHAKSGRPAYICIKVNSLTDPAMIEDLYEASEAGVEVDLIIRRHCALRPGVVGMSSRIRVKSIVGRFLEHSRLYLFGNGMPVSAGSATLFFGSADLMERNLDERAEILVPVESEKIREEMIDGILHANIKDERQSWVLDRDNNYLRRAADEGFSAQSFFMEQEDPAILGHFSRNKSWGA